MCNTKADNFICLLTPLEVVMTLSGFAPKISQRSQSLYPPLGPIFLQLPFNQRIHILYRTYGNVN